MISLSIFQIAAFYAAPSKRSIKPPEGCTRGRKPGHSYAKGNVMLRLMLQHEVQHERFLLQGMLQQTLQHGSLNGRGSAAQHCAQNFR
jgi:hypothetical protein